MKYAVIIEKGTDGYGAYVPDLPGCVSMGDTPQEALTHIRQAIDLHLEGMKDDGEPIPEPTSTVDYVEPSAA